MLNTDNDSERSKMSRIKAKIDYITYCHSKIEDLKSSIYQRASILVVVVAFIVPSCASVVLNIFQNNLPDEIYWRIILIALSVMFLASFTYTSFCGIKCMIPLKSRDFLVKILNKNRSSSENISFSELSNMDQDLSIKEFLQKKNIVSDDKMRVFTTFEHICDMNEPDFTNKVDALDAEKILEQLVSAIYNLSHITKLRYKDLFNAYKSLLMNILIFVIIMLVDIILNVL